MPELPEVETVRRGLHHLISGYRIVDALRVTSDWSGLIADEATELC